MRKADVCVRRSQDYAPANDSVEVTTEPDLPLTVVYVPNRHFGWRRGAPELGGYRVAVEACNEAGEETTVAAALDDLAEKLEWWVEPEWHDDRERWIEPDRGQVGEAVREALSDGTLRAGLEAIAGRSAPSRDESTDGLPDRNGQSEDLPLPTLYGFEGDGEVQVEVCASAPTAGWALAWLQHLGHDPYDWRVLGRLWSRFDPKDGGAWWISDRGDPDAVEFWQLNKVRR